MKRSAGIFWIAALCIFCVSAYVQFVSGYAGDRDLALLAGREWLSGKKAYVDIFELNPPLILWVGGLAVFLAQHVGYLQDSEMLVVIGFAAVALSTGMSLCVVSRHSMVAGNRQRQAQFTLLLAYVLIVWPNPVYFCDREHLLLTLTMPYVLRFMPSLARQPLPFALRLVIGLMAGLGFCMKPHSVIAFSGIQLIYMLRERSLRILASVETLLVYFAGAIYLSMVYFVTPEYVHIAFPMALATYSSYGNKISGIEFLLAALFVFAVTFIDFRPRHQSPYRKDIYYLLSMCLVYLFYALANNGWGYAYNVLISMLLVTTGWVLWEFDYLRKQAVETGASVRQFQFGIRDCWIVFAGCTAFNLLLYGVAFTSDCGDNAICRLHDEFEKVMKEDHARSFGTITTTFVFWPNLARATGAAWDTRFHHLWMMPKFFESDASFAEKNRWILDYVSDALASDLDKRKPEVVFVDNNETFNHGKLHVDLAAYFNAFPRFREAWRRYHFERSITSCSHPEKTWCRYDIYRRESSVGPP